MRPIRHHIVLVALFCSTVLAASKSHYVHYSDANWINLIGPPPLPDSAQQKSELATLLALQSQRTPAQEKRCKAEVRADAFYFARVLGAHFNEHDCPITAQLLRDATADSNSITDHVKRNWNRLRPYVTDPRIEPCVTLEKSSSYPSGHAVGSMVRAMVLAEMFPEKRDALIALGQQIGYDREIAGVHYPSDVTAGQKLGAAIAAKLLMDRDFQNQLAKASQECHTAVH